MARFRLVISGLIALVVMLSAQSGTFAQSQVGVWQNVTPGNVNLSSQLDCGNFGTQNVVVDPARPSNLYAEFNCQGIWKSTDYGQTWTGPINTGTNGSCVGDTAGNISIARGTGTNPPTLYQGSIRGCYIGFARSTDGGINWQTFTIGPAPAGRQDIYVPAVDPYDGNHLIVPAHELNLIYQSVDGGQTWTNVAQDGGMNEPGGSAFLTFINTGNASTTRNTWLWMAQGTGGGYGTWRTINGGTSWSKVDNNEHGHGSSQIFQPDNNGVVYMAGIYSAQGWGALRSTDYGATWTHVGNSGSENVAFGTPNRVWAAWSWACGIDCDIDPGFENATSPGITGWASVARPSGMSQGPAGAATTFDGSNYVIVTANWVAGIWRYVEPAGGAIPTLTNTPTPAPPTATPTNTAVPTATSTPAVPTNTPTLAPSATPTAPPVSCKVVVLVNGVQTAVTRPALFCTDQ